MHRLKFLEILYKIGFCEKNSKDICKSMTILYWVCILALLHTYIFYPLILKILARGKANNSNCYELDEELPMVSILMAAYNEEMVIEDKIKSILASDFPKDKLQFFIGSDNSNDATNEIASHYAKQYDFIYFKNFSQRQGKPGIINQLHQWAGQKKNISPHHIFIITDANVMFSPQMIRELVKHYKNEKIALVDSNLINVGMQKAGISKTENKYIKGEVQMKHLEGVIWQQTLGPLGGCFSMRSNYYSEVPAKYLVDDFYLAMRVFEQDGKAINEPLAVCYEDVSHSIKEEVRRKKRIATGNFQNLKRFWKLWLTFPPTTLSFIFISHKVIRWFGPLLIILSSTLAGILAWNGNLTYQILFLMESSFLLVIPIGYFILQSLGFHSGMLRTITYFNAANLALLRGLFQYLKGVKSNVWQPTKRNTTRKTQHD